MYRQNQTRRRTLHIGAQRYLNRLIRQKFSKIQLPFGLSSLLSMQPLSNVHRLSEQSKTPCTGGHVLVYIHLCFSRDLIQDGGSGQHCHCYFEGNWLVGRVDKQYITDFSKDLHISNVHESISTCYARQSALNSMLVTIDIPCLYTGNLL